MRSSANLERIEEHLEASGSATHGHDVSSTSRRLEANRRASKQGGANVDGDRVGLLHPSGGDPEYDRRDAHSEAGEQPQRPNGHVLFLGLSSLRIPTCNAPADP